MAYGDFKDLTRRAAFDKTQRRKALNIAKNSKYDGYQRDETFNKKSSSLAQSETLATRDKSASGNDIKNENITNKELAEELHKPIIRKFKKGKVHSLFIQNSWGADLEDIQLISKFNKVFRFFICFIDIYSKYAWVIPLEIKKGIIFR